MKNKDERIINIVVPGSKGSQEISFCVPLSTLENKLKRAKLKGDDSLVFNVKHQTVKIANDQIKQFIELAQRTFGIELKIPKELRKYVTNLSLSACTKSKEKLSARDEELEKIWSFLSMQQKNNCVLLGHHGVGKTTMIYEVARRIKHKDCPENFQASNVLCLNTLSLLNLADRSVSMYKKVCNKLVNFIVSNNKNIIFYIDNLFHIKCDITLLGIFTEFVKRYHIKIVASIVPDNFENYFETDYGLMKYLNPILIDEPEIEDIYPMLKSRINKLQKRYMVKISKKMIKFAILTGLHLSSSNSANPESTLDVIEFALADASRKQEKEVTKSNILAYYCIDFKLAKKTSKKEKYITAYHEAGHYVVLALSNFIKTEKNAFVSILPISGALGITANYYELGEQLTYSRNYYIDQIASCLGGRVGEKLYTNELSSGANADLKAANSLAEQLVLSYGMSNIEGEENRSYMVGNYVKDFLLTDEQRTKIHNDITETIKEAYTRAEQIIQDNQELLDEIVAKLVEENILMNDELDEICKKYR